MTFDRILWVVCGTYAEYEQYLRMKSKKPPNHYSLRNSRYQYLSSIDNLRGLTEVHGVFYGSWRERMDIEHIIALINIINKTSKTFGVPTDTPKDSRIGSLGFMATENGIVATELGEL